MALSSSHQIFLQTFMSKGILAGSEVKKTFRMACEAGESDDNVGNLVDMVRTINEAILPLHLEIKKGESEQNGIHFYGLVSTAEPEVSKLASTYSKNEYEFIKKLIEAVVESEEGGVSSTEAINLTTQLTQTMSKQVAQEFIDRLERDRWVVKTDEGQLHLSTRCILDMSLYIQQQFKDSAVDCHLCNKLVIQGQRCGQCDIKLHLPCASKFFNPDVEAKCPGAPCGAPWPHDIPARNNVRDTQGSPVKNTQQSQSRKRKSTT